MITGNQFVMAARAAGIEGAVGVPCSYLTGVYNAFAAQGDGAFIGATNEGEALAIASGAWLAGRRLMVMCQNSGLGNMVNPVTSLSHTFAIPAMLLLSWRGRPGFADEPQHQFMGWQMRPLLDALEVQHEVLESDIDGIVAQLARLCELMDATSRPVALILPDGLVQDEPYRAVPQRTVPHPRVHDLRTFGPAAARAGLLREVLKRTTPDTAIIATTGKTGREMFTLEDRPSNLYMVGSMGCASALGLGVALHHAHPVVVLDGDGAALMRLGNWATIGGQAPALLVHVLLENGVHDSTGGQATNGALVDFSAIAVACGYRHVFRCDDIDGFGDAFSRARQMIGPCLIVARIRPGSMHPLARPTVTPSEVARRFRSSLASMRIAASAADEVCA